MLEAARQALAFASGKTRQSLDDDLMLVFALTRAIEIIDEAAAHVSQEVRDEHPQIPWPEIIGMRNRLIHAYFDINLDRLWDTVQYSIPMLIAKLERLIPPASEG